MKSRICQARDIRRFLFTRGREGASWTVLSMLVFQRVDEPAIFDLLRSLEDQGYITTHDDGATWTSSELPEGEST